MRLLLIRHAESVGNAEFRLQGRRDFPLTPAGEQQAAALAARLAGCGASAVYSSPLLRTRLTADAIAASLGVPVVKEERLVEYDFGERISGLTWEVIRREHPEVIESLLRDESEFPRYPGEEGRGAFRVRVEAALTEIAERHRADPAVAVVTHAGPIAVYLMQVLGRKYSRPIPFAIENASVTTVAVGEPAMFAAAVVTGINDTCHLR
jgi:broad specificity phosphatase PhoE